MLRHYLNVLLILALLLQANVSMAMQLNMAQSKMTHTITHTENEKTPCHLTVNMSLQNVISVSDNTTKTPTPNHDYNTSVPCCDNNMLCCSVAILPAAFAVVFNTMQHPAPIAVLFKHLPAPVQRPNKPPRI